MNIDKKVVEGPYENNAPTIFPKIRRRLGVMGVYVPQKFQKRGKRLKLTPNDVTY
jgi:hypothetical protein